MKVILFKKGGLPDRRLHQSLGSRTTVLLEQARVQRPRVDPDPQGRSVVGGGLADVLHLIVEATDVAGVDPDGTAAGLDRLEHVLRLEVNIGDDGDARLLGDDRQRIGILVGRAGHANNVAPGGR